jgi:transcriptional regulator with XRE-family HTH domain
MRLRKWLESKEMSAAEFARVSGVGQRQLIYKYLHGIQFPSPENLLRIRNATNGEVTADDFVDQHTDPPGAPSKRKAA